MLSNVSASWQLLIVSATALGFVFGQTQGAAEMLSIITALGVLGSIVGAIGRFQKP